LEFNIKRGEKKRKRSCPPSIGRGGKKVTFPIDLILAANKKKKIIGRDEVHGDMYAPARKGQSLGDVLFFREGEGGG